MANFRIEITVHSQAVGETSSQCWVPKRSRFAHFLGEKRGGEGSGIGLFCTRLLTSWRGQELSVSSEFLAEIKVAYLLRVRGEPSVSYEFRAELNVYSQPGGEGDHGQWCCPWPARAGKI